MATPGEIIFESTAAGMFVIDGSLDRPREMRATTDTVVSSQNFGAKQGVLGSQRRRPGMRAGIYPEE